jgi:hypothetical protein
MLVDDVSESDVDEDVVKRDVDEYVFEGGVDGDVVVLSMLLETQFLINLIVVTTFWGFSCDEM